MFKSLLTIGCSLLTFAHLAFASTQHAMSSADRAKIDLGEVICKDTRLSQPNLVFCESTLNQISQSNWSELIPKLEADPRYIDLFQKSYNGKINPKTISDAILQYEVSLKQPSRFDEYMQGDTNALSKQEILGYQLFKSYGCAVCHNGPNFGGSKFKKMGVAKNYLIEHRTVITSADLGLYEVTKDTNDVYVFKVPTLRNIGIMSTYYHDGSVKTLREAVYLMGKYQLGVEIPSQHIDDIVAFLKSLTATDLAN